MTTRLASTLRRTTAITAVVLLSAITLTACGSEEPGDATASSVATTAAPVVETVTQEETEVDDETTTETDDDTTTATTTEADTPPTPTGGDDNGGGTNACPDPATLSAVTPDYDPQYPINSINCSQDWAVGTYEADGKNQTTAIWKNVGGSWAFQDRATVCAQADHLPDELYQQACAGS